VEACVQPETGNGVLVSHGGPANGYALALRDGEPIFYIRTGNELGVVSADEPLGQGWHHIVGALESNRTMRLYIDGTLVASATAPGLISRRPAQPLEFGVDSGGSVGDYEEDFLYSGLLDEVVIYFRELSLEEIQSSAMANARSASNAVVACTFDNNDARDQSGNNLNGVMAGVEIGKGKSGTALRFRNFAPSLAAQPTATNTAGILPITLNSAGLSGGTSNLTLPSTRGSRRAALAGTNTTSRGGGTFVNYDWTSYVPVVTRALSMAGGDVVVAGAPDLVNEEVAFEKLTQKDPGIQNALKEQDAALNGQRGASVKVVGKGTGQVSREFTLDTTPVWDGMAVAHGRIYIVTSDGKIQCYGKPPPPQILP
jgi:hypothetical protein